MVGASLRLAILQESFQGYRICALTSEGQVLKNFQSDCLLCSSWYLSAAHIKAVV